MGNQTARDFFWFYFSLKVAGATFLVAGGNPWLLHLYDSPDVIRMGADFSVSQIVHRKFFLSKLLY